MVETDPRRGFWLKQTHNAAIRICVCELNVALMRKCLCLFLRLKVEWLLFVECMLHYSFWHVTIPARVETDPFGDYYF